MRHAGLPHGGESQELARAARFARGFSLLLALAYALMVLGALVRAHGAGLACPDWPLCFGELVPRFDFRIAFEWGHRLIAGSVSLIFAALALGVTNDPALRRIAGRPLLLATALLGLQIVLGGLTVLHTLASWTVTAHLVTGNGFALTLLILVLRLRDRAAGRVAASEPIAIALRTLVTASALILTAEIVLGGLVSSRYAGLACSEWPACLNGAFFPTFEGAVGLHLLHRLNAYLLVGLLALTAWTARGVCGLERPTALALALVLVQACLGVANVLLRIPVEITALHTATAVALVLTTAFCVHAAWLRPLPAVDAAAPGSRPRRGAEPPDPSSRPRRTRQRRARDPLACGARREE
jgi:cytochrome c oxidase assembly protein subunit 15